MCFGLAEQPLQPAAESSLPCCSPLNSNAEVEEQISQLRSQLLHIEQEKELMRIKLEEEVAEKEKAQKQVRGVVAVSF